MKSGKGAILGAALSGLVYMSEGCSYDLPSYQNPAQTDAADTAGESYKLCPPYTDKNYYPPSTAVEGAAQNVIDLAVMAIGANGAVAGNLSADVRKDLAKRLEAKGYVVGSDIDVSGVPEKKSDCLYPTFAEDALAQAGVVGRDIKASEVNQRLLLEVTTPQGDAAEVGIQAACIIRQGETSEAVACAVNGVVVQKSVCDTFVPTANGGVASLVITTNEAGMGMNLQAWTNNIESREWHTDIDGVTTFAEGSGVEAPYGPADLCNADAYNADMDAWKEAMSKMATQAAESEPR